MNQPKKRVRLKPETRQELIARLQNPILSMHETAILIEKSRSAVRYYANKGELASQRTEGNQRCFAFLDVVDFMKRQRKK